MKKISFLFVVLGLAFFGAIAWWQNSSAPVNKHDSTKKTFSIEQGMGVREIANELKAEGLIKDPVVFFLIVKQLGLDGKIQAGQFYLSPSMSAPEIAKALQVGTFDVQVTIPEGKRAEEVAEILQGKFSQYDDSWVPALKAHEGYLFPDTYAFPKDASIDDIVKKMTDTFDEKLATLPSGRRNLSEDELVTIASMVEREALYAEDRPLVASVIFNRIKEGMVLNIDATIQYALGYQPAQKTWWKKSLSLDDLEVASSYNTYKNAGLPPGPISSPGLDVLQAVMNAPDTDYLFYVSDKQGHNHYTKTLESHNANIEKYGL